MTDERRQTHGRDRITASSINTACVYFVWALALFLASTLTQMLIGPILATVVWVPIGGVIGLCIARRIINRRRVA